MIQYYRICILVLALVLPSVLINYHINQSSLDFAGKIIKDYKLVWSDEFSLQQLDNKNWRYRYLGPRRDGINVEDTVSVNNGHLVLSTKKVGEQYHTAMISTKGLFETRYGFFQARIKLQEELGHWSAFWLQTRSMGKHIGMPSKAGTEIDIYEYLRKEGDLIRHALHWDGYKEDHKSAGKRTIVKGLTKGWHTFGLLWTENEYVFTVDGKISWRTSKAVSKRSQYMILSLEVGKWAGDISKAKLPDSVHIDYIRVYQSKK